MLAACCAIGWQPHCQLAAKALLQRAVKTAPADGFDRLMQANARAILAPLDKGDVKTAQATAKRLSPLGSVR